MPSTLGIVASARVAPPWMPTAIPGCVAWFDASHAASIIASAGAVSQWSDRSGLGNHVTQATAAKKPTTGLVTQNGRNVISFDGDDWLKRTGHTPVAATAYSIFAVFRKTGANTAYEAGPLSLSNAASGRPIDMWGGNRWCEANQFSGGANYPNINLNTSWSQLTWKGIKGTNPVHHALEERKNGAAAYSNILNYTITWQNLSQEIVIASRADGVTSLRGDIAEIVLYDSALSDTDRNTVESYLKAKWGTP